MEEKGRIEYIDIAKGIGIVLVVLGHSNMPEFIAKWIYSFHMPLFFLISGFFARESSFFYTIRKKTKTLLIPYILFSIISVLMLKILNVKYFNAEIIELFTGWNTYSLWFLPVLFITEICYSLLVKYINSKLFLFVIAILLYLSGYIFYLKDIHLWYKIEVVVSSLAWYIIGYLAYRFYKIDTSKLLFYVNILCLYFMSVILSTILPRFDMASNSLGIFPFNHLNALFGIFFIFLLSMKLARYKFFKYIFTFLGTNTMIILCTHQLLIFSFKNVTSFFWEPCLIDSIFRQILFWSVIPIVIYVINKKFYFLIGKY